MINVDELSYQVFNEGKLVPLPCNFFMMFKTLYKTPNRVYTRSQLLDIVSPTNLDVADRYVDTVVCRVNKAFGKKVIKTRRGIGYYYVS